MRILKKIINISLIIIITALITGGLVFLWVRLMNLQEVYDKINQTNQYWQQQVDLREQTISQLEEQINQFKENNQPLWFLPGDNFNLNQQPEKYTTTWQANETDSSKTDIFIKNIRTGENISYITLSNIASDHYHVAEYHNGNLYILKISTVNNKLQLWKYDAQKKGSLLYESDDLDFRVSPYEKYVVLLNQNRLMIMSKDGIIKSYNHFQLGVFNESFTVPYIITLDNWSDNGLSLWGGINEAKEKRTFWQINSQDWQVEKYDTKDLLIQLNNAEMSLNANSGKLAFSTLPIFYDPESERKFFLGNKEVKLYIYDLDTKENKEIAVAIAKKFEPQWLNQHTLEYTDPQTNTRKQISL